MSDRARLILKAGATVLALLVVGIALWWAAGVSDPDSTADEPLAPAGRDQSASEAPPELEVTVTLPTPEPTAVPPPTPTPLPSPTAVPDPVAFADLIGRPDLAAELASPLPEQCPLTQGDGPVGTITLRCIPQFSAADVASVGAGRIVHISSEPVPGTPVGYADPTAGQAPTVVSLGDGGGGVEGQWSWSDQPALGRHVVIDHGPYAGSRSVQTVYGGLNGIVDSLQIGQIVEAGTVLGSVLAPEHDPYPQLHFSLWVDNVRQDGASVVVGGPDAETQRQIASALGAVVASPTDPLCPLALGSSQLPGASRAYRNGTHQGIDFGCGTSGRYGHAIADGTVVYLIDDYVDPTVADREALLHQAALAGFTPHWTLVMLYGNVVVIDHGDLAGVGRVYTITAHLETVDPMIELGAQVSQGQVLGELGNRGTNASAEGRRGAADPSLHLHWELFVDNWFLGSGQTPAVVEELVTSLLCTGAATPGCPQ